ncbi:DUF4132 domain-containing protein [bacterium]|nr:DUF4132 domain-containing protein [bacterium]
MHWVETGDGYALRLEAGKLLCRNAKGKVLASVPKTVRESPQAEQLLQLRDWLAVHARECLATVERWMLRSLPVPLELVTRVWPDPDWRNSLLNLLVLNSQGEVLGFLREASQRGLGVVDMDGESQWLEPAQIVIPHPILLPDLNEYREILTELQLNQVVNQLFRESWSLPAEDVTSVSSFAEGKFAQVLHVQSRSKNLGYPVRGGFACCSVWQAGQVVQARFWIGAGSPEEETYTGNLGWVDSRENPLSAHQAGPVAYSEGMRMASQIYTGRVVEKESE